MRCLVRLVLSCERPDVELRQLEQRLPRSSRSCRHRLRLCKRGALELAPGTSGKAVLQEEELSPIWLAELPHGSSLAYEGLAELLEQLEEATRRGVPLVLLGWRRELSLWRQEASRPGGPLQLPVDAFWLAVPLPRGAVLRRAGAALPAAGELPELSLCAALAAKDGVLRLPAPFLRLRSPVPASRPQREEWIRDRDRAISGRREIHGWSAGMELELRRHGRWLMAWSAAEQHCWEEALRWWQRGALQRPGSLRRHWFEAMRLFCRSQNEQPGPVSVADLLRHPLWRQQGLRLLPPADVLPVP